MGNKATEVLERQIADVKEKIVQNKIEIADLFVKVHNFKSIMNTDFETLMERISEMNKMVPLLAKLERNETKLEILLKSQTEILSVCSC
ncbi:MAG: hypothetical protein IKB70_05990 [Bacilli bacterium]|nr:hypothetical protein [bacterium]MBR2506455.1 hypothetical protein [Bacilli bacterium]